jgi:hypothetical protein
MVALQTKQYTKTCAENHKTNQLIFELCAKHKKNKTEFCLVFSPIDINHHHLDVAPIMVIVTLQI